MRDESTDQGLYRTNRPRRKQNIKYLIFIYQYKDFSSNSRYFSTVFSTVIRALNGVDLKPKDALKKCKNTQLENILSLCCTETSNYVNSCAKNSNRKSTRQQTSSTALHEDTVYY